ncbi:MAG: cell division protein ZapA [Burkholderiales bacterium]|nr:cell division protein ZapA [Burkholderiales bacterium]
MTAKKGVLDVTILGRSYKVSCAEDEREELLQAVSYLDGKMGQIKASGKVASTERIAVMAALNIAHEYLAVKTPGGFDIADLKRRIEAMQAMLEQALAPQEKLF